MSSAQADELADAPRVVNMAQIVDEHERIVEAVARRDPAGASQAMADHLSHVRDVGTRLAARLPEYFETSATRDAPRRGRAVGAETGDHVRVSTTGGTMPIETMYLANHSHTDIAFTDHQDVIFRQHEEFIDGALDLIEATADYPDEARYRWTCESSGVLERWLAPRLA